MTDDRPSDVLGSLPRTRPHRRSQKRPARRSDAQAKPARLHQPAQPPGTPPGAPTRKPVPASSPDLLATVLQATAELAEIGLSVTARTIRGAVSRLPRP